MKITLEDTRKVNKLAAIFCQGGRRTFWIGFILFGWVYLLMAFEPWTDQAFGTQGYRDPNVKHMSIRVETPHMHYLGPGGEGIVTIFVVTDTSTTVVDGVLHDEFPEALCTGN